MSNSLMSAHPTLAPSTQEENANFAFNGIGTMGHKNYQDVPLRRIGMACIASNMSQAPETVIAWHSQVTHAGQ